MLVDLIHVMTVHKVGAVDAVGYCQYLASKDGSSRRGDYYLGTEGRRAEATGYWLGRGAERLGLAGEVSRQDLLRVWEGRHPRTGEIEVRRSATGQHVAAIDCTFSAPKSVSVAWALSRPGLRAEIEAVQTRAVACAVGRIEEGAPLLRRRVDGHVVNEPAAGVIAARFRHHTSRVSAAQEAVGSAADPQLHDHVAISNMALRSPEAASVSGTWAAVDSRELYRIAAEAGAVYRAELAAGLQDLGFSTHREGRYFELDAIPIRVRRAFSSRTAEVEAAVADFAATYGRPPTDIEAKELTVRTRGAKAVVAGPAFEDWRDRAMASGLDPAAVEPKRRSSGRPEYDEGMRSVLRQLTDPASDTRLIRDDSAVDTRHLRIATAEAAQGYVAGRDISALIKAVETSPMLVRLRGGHWTTQEMFDTECEVVARARRLAAISDRSLSRETVELCSRRARVVLSEEQRSTARRLCDGRAIALLEAPAGSGKGEVLSVVAHAHRAQGRRVIALAVAGETAQRLGRETGAEVAATIDSFTLRLQSGTLSLSARDLVILDEAALVETSRWRGLLRATGDAKVIAAGDPHQLQPIEAGGIWRVLTDTVGADRLHENFRARQGWANDAWNALREGRSAAAIVALEHRGQVSLAENRASARDVAVAIWERERRGGRTVLLLTDSSNVEVDRLNKAAQEQRLAAREIDGPFLTVVSAHRNGVTERRERLFSGDEVVVQRRLFDCEGRTLVRNGTEAVVESIDPDSGAVTLMVEGREVTLAGKDTSAVRLGYARHAYTAQGRTVDEVVVLAGGWQTDRETSYVGVSRARDASFVVADYSSLDVTQGDREAALRALAERTAVSHRKTAAITLGVAEGQERSATKEVVTMANDQDDRDGARSQPRSRSAEVIGGLSERWTWTRPGSLGRDVADNLSARIHGEPWRADTPEPGAAERDLESDSARYERMLRESLRQRAAVQEISAEEDARLREEEELEREREEAERETDRFAGP